MSNLSNYQISQPTLNWLIKLMNERFGLSFYLTCNKSSLELRLKRSSKFVNFDFLQSKFYEGVYQLPCAWWRTSSEVFNGVVEESIPAPGVSALPAPLIELLDTGAVIHYDILGLAYWMLNRIEEIGRTDLDEHERFPATASHAYKHGYLERPIVDEWLDILGQVIQKVWPDLKLKQHKFQMRVSHDVDRPSRYGFRSFGKLARAMVGDVVRYGNYRGAFFAPFIRLTTKKKLSEHDSFNTFNWLMTNSEEHCLKSAFYFICGRTHEGRDGDYEVEHPAIRALLREIADRGHEIGLHPSYNTFRNPDALKQEAQRLAKVCTEESISQDGFGGRMHYLRWEHPTTMRAWADAGMKYDSTLGYADHIGFRCGTCFEYPAFDPVKQEILDLRVRPLIAMEGTVLSSNYMGLNHEEALERLLALKERCRQVGGAFTLLWHNSEFLTSEQKVLYQQVLAR